MKCMLIAILHIIATITALNATFSETLSRRINPSKVAHSNRYTWHCVPHLSFNELIISWNAPPTSRNNALLIETRLKKCNQWSQWAPCAYCGHDKRYTFPKERYNFFWANTDIIAIPLGTADELEIRATSKTTPLHLDSLHACVSNTKNFTSGPVAFDAESIRIPHIVGQSQMVLPHFDARRMCSPTSISTVINYYRAHYYRVPRTPTNPLNIAADVYDAQYGGYGSWPFNVASAYTHLDARFTCRVQRLNDFSELYSYLVRSIPVITSIQGPLSNSPLPFSGGHLLTIIGWNNADKKVICLDSSFDSDEKTYVEYDYKEFIAVWGNRRNLTYIIEPTNPHC